MFKSYWVYILYLVSLCLSIPLFSQQIWQKFIPPGQSFEVLSPGEMKNGEKSILTDIGSLQPVTWLHEGKAGDPNYLYLISYIDYAEGTFHQDSTDMIKALLDVSIETQVKTLSGDLVYQSEAPFGLHPGVVFRASYNNNKAVVKGKMILIRDRLYVLQVYTLSEKSLNPDMDIFLDSFKTK
jgi:hypothetical protein